jgi:hypothetical protein
MNTQDAMKTLATGGKTREVRELLAAAADAADRKFAQIRDAADFTDDAKRRHLAIASVRVRYDLDDKLERLAARVVSTDRDDAAAVFGTRGLPGDAASLAISRRDAADRVGALTAVERRDLLRRATRSGDEVLARAIVERAIEEQDDITVHQFCEDRPELDAPVERLWNGQRGETDSMMMSLGLLGLRPAELAGMSSDAIEHLAETEPTLPPAPV